jgi:hypothetical protein
MLRPQIIFAALVYFVFGCLLLTLSCSCTPTHPITERTEQVSIKSLIGYYKDFPAETANSFWQGKKIRVFLTPGIDLYEVRRNEVHVFSGLPRSEAIVIFYCGIAIPEGKSLELVGRLKGKTADGKNRGGGVTWFLEVEDCSVVIR